MTQQESHELTKLVTENLKPHAQNIVNSIMQDKLKEVKKILTDAEIRIKSWCIITVGVIAIMLILFFIIMR